MSSFFQEVIAALIKVGFEGHTRFSVSDPTAVGDNSVRSIKLDAVEIEEGEAIISLSWEGGEKIFEKKMSSEECSHEFSLVSTDLSEVQALTKDGKYDEAKNLMSKLTEKYSANTDAPVQTNLPPVNNTQADLNDSKIWKEAKVTMQNLFFSSTDELMQYQKKMKELQPNSQDGVPLWEQNKGEGNAEESETLAPPSLSYEDQEENKEKETKNLDRRIKDQVKTELESALEEKKATMFGEADKKFVDGMRAVGRTWDEIKKYMVKDLSYDKESVDMYIDDLRNKEDGVEVIEEKVEPLRPPKDLVTDETHEKLLDEVKKEEPVIPAKPVEEVKEKEIEKIESSKTNPVLCPECSGKGTVEIDNGGGKPVKITCPTCQGDRHILIDEFTKEVDSQIERADNSDIRKMASWHVDYQPHNSDTRKVKHGFSSKEEAEEWAKSENLFELSEDLDIAEDVAVKIASAIPSSVKKQIETEIANSIYLTNAPGSDAYRFSLDGGKIYRGEYIDTRVDDFGPYEYIYNFDTQEYKQNPNYKPSTFASLHRVALNPLQEPPVVEEPTTLLPQDTIPMGNEVSQGHVNPQKGDRVFVSSDLDSEKAGFEAVFVSSYKSKGTDYSIVEQDDGELVDVESHRLSTIDENQAPEKEPSFTPAVESQELHDGPSDVITPSLSKLTSDLHKLLSINAELQELEESFVKEASDERIKELVKELKDGIISLSSFKDEDQMRIVGHLSELIGRLEYLVSSGEENHPASVDINEAKSTLKFFLEKRAVDPVVPTKFKEVKITPDFVDKEKALPASPDQAEVITRIQTIEANLAILDRTKEEVAAKLKAELQKIDNDGKRNELEAEFKSQIEKLSSLIDGVDSKLIKFNNMFYAFQQETKTVDPKIDYKDLLDRVAKKFEGVDRFVQNVLNGMKALSTKITTRTLTRWPEKRSELDKQATSVSEDLDILNSEMEQALQLLSDPIV